ncbi:hypothetical protein GJ496_011781, partial [Pomphorhynchus laevis]
GTHQLVQCRSTEFGQSTTMKSETDQIDLIISTNKFNAQTWRATNKPQSSCTRCGRQHTRFQRCSATEKTCRRCRKIGHFEACCRNNLQKVLERFKQAGVKVKHEKCSFLLERVKFLGHVLTKDCIQACTNKLEAIQKIPTPTNKGELRSFLGAVNYLKRFIPSLQRNSKSLYELSGRRAVYSWKPEHTQAFEKVKESLMDSHRTGWGSYVVNTQNGERRRHADDLRTNKEVNTNRGVIEITGNEKLNDHKPSETIRRGTSCRKKPVRYDELAEELERRVMAAVAAQSMGNSSGNLTANGEQPPSLNTIEWRPNN